MLRSQRVELIRPVRADSVYAEFVKGRGYRIHHLGLLVTNIKASLAKAACVGLAMTMDGTGFGRDEGRPLTHTWTPRTGLPTRSEFIRRPAGRVPPENVYP